LDLGAAVGAVFADEAFVAVVVEGGAAGCGAAAALGDGFGDAAGERVVVVVGSAAVCIADVGQAVVAVVAVAAVVAWIAAVGLGGGVAVGVVAVAEAADSTSQG
jgi:hypothetical protein